MQALRQQTQCCSRRILTRGPRSRRGYASGSHGSAADGHAPVNESLGTAFYIFAGVVPASLLVYYVSRPSSDGESTRITKLIDSASDLGKRWEERNTLHTAAIEQAAHDKHLFYNVERSKHVELKFPEIFQTGSPYNVPAGHSVNLDKVVAHYQDQHHKEEERKAVRAARAAEAGREQGRGAS